MDKKKIRLAMLNGNAESIYHELVEEKIRARYTVGEELAIVRQRDRKPQEFAEYDAYCEKCKREAKEELGL